MLRFRSPYRTYGFRSILTFPITAYRKLSSYLDFFKISRCQFELAPLIPNKIK